MIISYFPSDAHIHLCNFHCEKSWKEWVSKKAHKVSDSSEEVLNLLRAIADSSDKGMMEEAIQELRTSKSWQESEPLQDYFTGFWLLHVEVIILMLTYVNFYRHFIYILPFFQSNLCKKMTSSTLKKSILMKYFNTDFLNCFAGMCEILQE